MSKELDVILMRMLMFHVTSFWYRVNESDESDPGVSLDESLLVWIHSEEKDEQDRISILRKMVKNVRWLAQKNDVTSIILHPFAHLEDSKSDPEFAERLIEETAERLRERDFSVHIVEYGVFTEFKTHVKGPSLAKVFKQF
ncbi:MAG: threonyl-tRNA synthetase editing domain-containing protein [Candidatus Thorarchaeota archaeon]